MKISRKGMMKIGVLAVVLLLVSAFYFYFRFYVTSVRAAHTPTVFVDDTNDRIFPGGSGSTVRINVSNAVGSANNIQQVFFALPNGTSVSSIVAPSTWTCGCGANGGSGSCSLSGGSGNGFNCSSTSNKITAGTWVLFNFSMTPSTITNVGNWNWTTTDDAGTPASSTGNAYSLILSGGDIGIDLRDIGNNVLTGGLIRLILVNSAGGQVDNSSMKYENISSSGLYVWPASQINSLVGGLAPTSYSYVISQSTNPVRVPSAQESYSPTLTNVPSGTPIQLNTSLAQLSVSVFDQLSNNRTNANVSIYIVNGTACAPTSLLAINQTSPETNIVNFTLQAPNADSGMIYYVQATKGGYVDSYCTVVNLTSSFKVNLAFNGTRNNQTSTPYNNTFALQQGLNYSVIVLAENQLNGTITFNLTNTSFRGYSTLQTPGASSGVIFPTFNTSGVTAGNVFLNVTGSGQLEINVSGYVRKNTTSAITPVSTAATQIEYFNSTTSGTEADGLRYTFLINTLQTETGAALTQTSGDTVTVFNNNRQYTPLNITLFSGNNYIAVPNDTVGYVVRYNKTAFVSTNTSAIIAGYDSQTNVNYVNSTGQGQGLPYSLKVRIDDELGQDVAASDVVGSNISFALNYTDINLDVLNVSFTPNVTQFGAAFFAIPQNVSGMGFYNRNNGTNVFFVQVNKTGYVRKNTSALAITTTSQAFAEIALQFNSRINVTQDELGNLLTQTSSDTVTFYNTSDNSTFTTYTSVNTTLSSGNLFAALDPSYTYNITYFKLGFLQKNFTATIAQTAVANVTYSRFVNGLNYTVRLVAYDALEEGLGLGDSNTTFSGFENSTAVKYVSNAPQSFYNYTNVTAFISFIPNRTNVNITINVTGFVNQSTLAVNLSNSTTQATINFSLSAGGNNGSALNYTFIVDKVQDELGNTLTPVAGDQIIIYFPGTNIVHTPVKSPRLAAGSVWYLAVAPNTSWIVNYSRAGYINKPDTKTATSLRPTLVNYTQYSNGLNLTLRIDVYDELNSSVGMRDNMTFNIAFTSSPAPSDYVAITPNSTSTNSYYFGLSPANNTYALRIAKVGYVTKNGTFESALNNVGLGNITQTFLNLTGRVVCGTNAGNGTKTCAGMLFGIKATAGDEFSTNLSLASGNTTFIADPLAGANALTLNNSLTVFDGGAVYLAANSSGTGSKLEINVTGFVRTNTTNNILSTAYTYQQNASYLTGGSASSLQYLLKIGVHRSGITPAAGIPDSSVNVSNNQNTLFLYSSANQSANAYYVFSLNFTNYTAVNVSVFRTGYSSSAPTNNPLNITLSSTAQQFSNITLTPLSTGSIDGFVYLTNTTVRVNSTATVTALGSGITTSTDSTGYYKLTDLAVGTYTVAVTGSGYRGNQTTGVSVTAGGTTRNNQFVMGAENFNISIPGSVTSGNTNGFWDVGWHDFFLSTRAYGPTTNTTVALLFNSVGSNYTIVYRYNATSATWSSNVPGAAGNTLASIADSDDHYWTYINGTSRVELENRYT